MLYSNYTIGGELYHAQRLGTRKPKIGHKYIEKRISKNGKTYYVYKKIDKDDYGMRPLGPKDFLYGGYSGNPDRSWGEDYREGGMEYANLRSKAEGFNNKRKHAKWSKEYHEEEANNKENTKGNRDYHRWESEKDAKKAVISERRRAEATARAEKILAQRKKRSGRK